MTTLRVADEVAKLGSETKRFKIRVAHEVIRLLSEQLYASPVKAVEELVVNSWDAAASICSVLVDLEGDRPLIAVFDNGKGMNPKELEDLWHVGVSHKPKIKSDRKQIGKFGIGKLASYAVARRATYISKTMEGVNCVSIDFDAFGNTPESSSETSAVELTVRNVAKLDDLLKNVAFAQAARVLATKPKAIDIKATPTWTMVVLEDLKEKAAHLAKGRLKWVLETAMPLEKDFTLYLNGSAVESSKTTYEKRIAFSVDELDDSRLKDLGAVTGEKWERIKGGVKSTSFPAGVTGQVFVTKESLYAAGGKSEDLGRSHGFFVRVHNRLINETDALFGARPLSFTTWYRFAAIVEANDLNQYITASRDDVEQSDVKAKLRELLIQLFNQARDKIQALDKKEKEENERQKEGSRDFVSTELVERPLADALVAEGPEDPDSKVSAWRLIEPVTDLVQLQTLVESLYSVERKERRYAFSYSPAGALAPIARLNATTATFFVNEDHQLVREFSESPDARRLLEALIVAEALLEAYLHAADVDGEIVRDLIDRRDTLLRGLAADESYSLRALGGALRDSASNAQDLEIALVGALRALGFAADHIGGSGTPDGTAHYIIHGIEEKRFTLEAKSSADVPSLPQLDFAGLHAHFVAANAAGCLLVAPSYPGATDQQSQVSQRSRQQGVSCWTIEQLARVVEAAERRHINARSLQQIVFTAFTPIDVATAVEKLLSEPTFDKTDLYQGVLGALEELETRLLDTPRNVSLVAGEISRQQQFKGVTKAQIQEALLDLSRSSRGMLHVTDAEQIFVLGSLDELRRRVATVTETNGPPRRRGTFRAPDSI